jgi:hypothetical protein
MMSTDPTPRAERNLSTYALAAGAACLAGTGVHGEVIQQTLNLDVPLAGGAIGLDLDGDAVDDLIVENRTEPYYSGSWQVIQTPTTEAMTNEIYTVPGIGDFSYATPQASGALIDAAGLTYYFTNLSYGGLGPVVPALDAGPILLGFSMDVAGAQHFGWVRLAVDLDTGTYTILETAYEDTPGLGIEAGSLVSIPEPTSLGMLAAGAAGVGLYRRRRAS